MQAGFQPTIRQGPLGSADTSRARAPVSASPVRGSDSMPVIMEAGSGAGQHWNPTNSWLPPEMTANGAPGRDPLPAAVNSQGTQTMPASELFERGVGEGQRFLCAANQIVLYDLGTSSSLRGMKLRFA